MRLTLAELSELIQRGRPNSHEGGELLIAESTVASYQSKRCRRHWQTLYKITVKTEKGAIPHLSPKNSQTRTMCTGMLPEISQSFQKEGPPEYQNLEVGT